jgi:lipopolysaccharide export system permease protein
MKIIDRYILKESFIYFSITLFAFMSILLTVRMLRFASLIVNKGVEINLVVGVFLSIIPSFLELAIPMATLLGVMMACARLSGDSEIVVLRASGVSLFQLVRPVLIFACIMMSISFWVSLSLKPWGFQNLNRVLFQIAQTKSTSGLVEGVFNELGSLTLYAEKIDHATGALSNVLIDDQRDELERKVTLSHSGFIHANPDRQTISFLLNEGVIHEIVNERYSTTRFSQNEIDIDSQGLLNGEKKERVLSIKEMSRAQLQAGAAELEEMIAPHSPWFNDSGALASPTPSPFPKRIDVPEGFALYPQLASKKEVRKRLIKMLSEEATRFSMPAATMIFALIALPLGVLPPRTHKTWGAGASLLLGLGVFISYYCLGTIGSALGERELIPLTLGVWLPNILLGALTAYCIKKVGREEWSSAGEAISEKIMALLKTVTALLPFMRFRKRPL